MVVELGPQVKFVGAHLREGNEVVQYSGWQCSEEGQGSYFVAVDDSGSYVVAVDDSSWEGMLDFC